MSAATTDIDDRIAAAFADGAKSDDVASLIGEVEAAAIAVGETAERARSRALDPVLSAPDVAPLAERWTTRSSGVTDCRWP